MTGQPAAKREIVVCDGSAVTCELQESWREGVRDASQDSVAFKI
jgi:hypothetical protein